jgi:catechol 2,3-dioxygenase-like lactoylglutathione lyase family enzyme
MHIHELNLISPDLVRQREFYGDTLGLPVTQPDPKTLRIQAGSSTITYTEGTVDGIYHFAFLIPENQFAEGRAWLEARLTPLAEEDGNTVIHHENWDAYSIYFSDAVGNNLELIARHPLPNTSDKPFDSNSLLNVNEIGLPTTDVLKTVAHIQANMSLAPYRGAGDENFTAMGDGNGFFITNLIGRMWLPDRTQPSVQLPATVIVSDNEGKRFRVTCPEWKIEAL